MFTVLTLVTILALPARLIVVLMRGLDMSVVDLDDEQAQGDHAEPSPQGVSADARVLVGGRS